MKQMIFNVYDTICERFIGDMIATNEAVALRAFKSMIEKNTECKPTDFILYKVAEYDSPILPDDVKTLHLKSICNGSYVVKKAEKLK